MTEPVRQPGLAAALAAFQAELPPVAKTKTAKVKGETRDGKPFDYEYKYADLADVSAAVMPLMGKHGLSFTSQPTVRDDGQFGLAYQLLHASGELIDGWYPLDGRLKVQQIGGHITYARRYCLCAVTGVAAEEDTDGQGLDHPQPAHRAPRSRPPARPKDELPRNTDGSVSRSRTTDEELAASGNMTDAELRAHNKMTRDTQATPRRAERLTETPADDPWYQEPPAPLPVPRAAQDPAQQIAMHFQRLGITDRDVRLGYTATLAGRDSLATTKDLTAAQGIEVIRKLQKCKDRDAFDRLLNEGAHVA